VNISQREARRLRKRVAELEQQQRRQRQVWANEYATGLYIGTVANAPIAPRIAIHTARVLGHVSVALMSGDDIKFYALPHADQ
jgi:hypothetical protein